MGRDAIGGRPSLSRRGMRRDPSIVQSHPQLFHSGSSQSPSGGFPYRSSPGSTAFLAQSPYSSPSPSSSSAGGAGMGSDLRSATLSLSSREVRQYPSVEDYLRRESGLSPHHPVHLQFIPDPGTRPNLTLKILASIAIFGSRDGKLTLQEIYEEIEKRFSWYRDQSKEGKKKWQVRHPLASKFEFKLTSEIRVGVIAP